MWDQLAGEFGVSATGSGQLNFGHAINNEWVTGAAGVDGKVYQYTDLGQALYDFSAAYGQAHPEIVEAVALENALAVPKNGATYAESADALAFAYGPQGDPDTADTNRYGQEIADINGGGSAHGVNFTEDPALSALFQGQTGISFIEQTLASYGTVDQAPAPAAADVGRSHVDLRQRRERCGRAARRP